MDAAIWHLSNAGPWTGAIGLLICIGAGYFRQESLERTGMWVCVIAACELAALKILQMVA